MPHPIRRGVLLSQGSSPSGPTLTPRVGELMDGTRAPKHRDIGPLRGELVRVRSREEILRTLDAAGDRASLPFMPEMLQFAGREMRVYARADKTCNTVDLTGTTLQLSNTVHLVGARCDGSAHGGCHAGCLLFWREE